MFGSFKCSKAIEYWSTKIFSVSILNYSIKHLYQQIFFSIHLLCNGQTFFYPLSGVMKPVNGKGVCMQYIFSPKILKTRHLLKIYGSHATANKLFLLFNVLKLVISRHWNELCLAISADQIAKLLHGLFGSWLISGADVRYGCKEELIPLSG